METSKASKIKAVKIHSLAGKASLSDVRRLIRAELNRVGADAALSFDCLVAVTEACTNAILHGRKERDFEPPPRVSWDIDPGCARFCVEDFSSQEWSKTSHPSRALQHEAADPDTRIGGFGLELMRGLMDEVDIEIGPAGTKVSLTKRLV